MNKLTFLAAVVLGLLQFGLLSGCDKHAKDKIEMRAAWDQYKQGNMTSNGEMVAQVMSQKTFDHYTRLVKLAMDAKAQDVWALSPTQMQEIFLMRTRSNRKELKSLDGRGYMVFATGKGWYADDDDGWKVVEIVVAGATAVGTVHHPAWEEEYRNQRIANALTRRRGLRGNTVDKPYTFTVQFVKESSGWKIDETSLFAEMDKDLQMMAKEERMSVRDMIMAMESMEQDRKIPMSVWDPMKK